VTENGLDKEVHVTQPPYQLVEEHNLVVEETSVTSSSSEVKEESPKSSCNLSVQEEDMVTSQQTEDTGVTDSVSANCLLDISHVPIMVAHATSDFTRSTLVNNFLKGCKWYIQLRLLNIFIISVVTQGSRWIMYSYLQ